MPQLRPIPAITYSLARGRDLSSRLSPPYDVLDEKPKQALLKKDRHNIVAIDLPVTPPKTVGPDSAYQQAAATLGDWLDQGVLTRADQPAIFAYEQVYTVGGQTLRRRGLFANLQVEPFNRPGGGIFRHEHTIRGGVDDRSKLTKATRCQLSPVFGIFSDPQAAVTRWLGDYFENREPDFFGTTKTDGTEHRCWQVTDAALIGQLEAFFLKKNVFIADGHHRYTTALNYHKQHPQGTAGTCLFVLVAREDPGMIVLPTHRVIGGLHDFSIDKLTQVIEPRQDVNLYPADQSAKQLDDLLESLPNHGHHGMGLYDPATEQVFLLTTTRDPLAPILPDMPEVWRYLDVAIVQHLLVEQLLMPHFASQGVEYKYTADLAELRQLATAAPGRVGVIVQATALESVCDVSLAGQVMPPKSTYFYPKLATGLVINPLS